MKDVYGKECLRLMSGILFSSKYLRSSRWLRLLVFLSFLLPVGRVGAGGFRLAIPIDTLKELHLKYPRDSFTISMSSDTDSASHIYYRWKLMEIDKEWSVSAASPVISYKGLKPGKYYLVVRMYEDEKMCERILPLVVTRPVWLSPWFALILALLAISLASYFFFNVRNKRRRRAAFEKLLVAYQLLEADNRQRGIVDDREKLRKAYLKKYEMMSAEDGEEVGSENGSGEVDSKDDDNTFLEKAMKCVRDNLTEEAFGKKDFASALLISESLLYKRIKTLTDLSVVEFIRSIRLNHAMSLLRTGDYNVTEVSEMCGFSSSAYFSRVFKDNFGIPPSDIITKVYIPADGDSTSDEISKDDSSPNG